MKDYVVVGKSLPRIDAREKASGEAIYITDLKLPRMLHGKILRSPLPHARILHIDTAAARSYPGVKAVITAADTPKKRYGLNRADELPLALDRARYTGEEVAAVAAMDEETAEAALPLIRVEYEDLPAVFDMEAAIAPGAPQLHEDAPGNIALRVTYDKGEVDKAFAQAACIVEDRFETSVVHQCYTEPRAAVASFDAGGRLTVWGPFQSPFRYRQILCQALDLPADRIRVIQPYLGGGFGGKSDSREAIIAALLSRQSGRPVRIANSREDELRIGRPAVPAIIHQKMAFARDGTILGKESRILADNGAYSSNATALVETMTTRHECLYRIKNVRANTALVYTNKTPTGAYRGFGNPQGTFSMEALLDRAARELGLDPMELRLKNATRSGDVTVHGFRISSCGLSDCINKVAAESGWKHKRTQPLPNRGVGMACAIHVAGNRATMEYDGSTAIITINEDGRVRVNTGEGDVGQGARTTLAQIAAEELGTTLDKVDISQADTDLSPFCLGAFADRVTMIGGNAVKLAAADAKRQLLSAAATLLEVNPDDLLARAGQIYVKGSPDRSATFAEVASAAIFRRNGSPILGQGSYNSPAEKLDKVTKSGNVAPTYVFGAQVAEVEVNPRTGAVKVLNITAADDIGFPINPMAAESQVEGAVAMGYGFTMMEALVWDGGNVVNANYGDYKMPTTGDLPPIHSILVETDDAYGPFGAKSIGESPIVPVLGAIVNAIYHAVGVQITKLPVTPEAVLAALKGQ